MTSKPAGTSVPAVPTPRQRFHTARERLRQALEIIGQQQRERAAGLVDLHRQMLEAQLADFESAIGAGATAELAFQAGLERLAKLVGRAELERIVREHMEKL